MSRTNLYHVHEMVETILECYPATRDSDNALYLMVMKELNPQALNMNFTVVMASMNQLGLPPYESVSRCRRKVQQERPDLRANKSVEDERYENWKEFRAYAEV